MPIETAVDAAYRAGFRGDNLVTAVAIAGAESGYDASQVFNGNPGQTTPEHSVGLWQINMKAHPEYDEDLLKTPAYNARAAFNISGGGVNFQPWSTFTQSHNSYLAYVPRAKVAVGKYLVGRGLQHDVIITGREDIIGDCLAKCDTQFPQSDDAIDPLNEGNRKDCQFKCFPGLDAGAAINARELAAVRIACHECSVTNIPACFACGAGYLTKGLVSIGVNILLAVLVIAGVYILFRPELNAQFRSIADSAKEGAKNAVKTAAGS